MQCDNSVGITLAITLQWAQVNGYHICESVYSISVAKYIININGPYQACMRMINTSWMFSLKTYIYWQQHC
eukprot:11695837-Ditylum_brightwellii.AAC.1